MKVCLSWLAVAWAVLPVRAEDWPRFRGPTGQGISRETGIPTSWSATENVAWKTPIPGEGWSSPIVTGDRVFLTTATDRGASFRMICLDRLTGGITWDREILRQKPGHKAGLNSFASSTPATDGRRVYAVAFDGTIAAVSMEGEVVWANRDFPYYSEHGLAVSPILHGDLVIVPFDGSSDGPDRRLGWQKPWDRSVIVALDRETGRVRWKGRRGLSRIAHVTPLVVNVNGEDQLVSSAGDVVQGFDLRTGALIWTVSSEGEGVVPSIVAGDGLIFATSGFGDPAIRAIRTGGEGDVTKTHIAWEFGRDVPMVPSMLYVKPYLFTVNRDGVVRCLKAETGEDLWRKRIGGRYSASPVWAEGRIYLLSEKGEAVIIDAGPAFKEIGRNSIDEECHASPAISRGQIFIRSSSALYCIGKAGGTAE